MIGPAVPVPVPQSVLDALTDVQITSASDGPSGFQLSFTLSTDSALHTLFLLTGGSPIPFVRVIVVVTVGGMPDVLMDGVMTNHEVRPGAGAGRATLTVTGEDLTRVMDYIELDGVPYPGMPGAARVYAILGKYAALGVLPLVVPPLISDVPNPVERIPRHKGTDLCYVRGLAADVGYVFYLEPGPAPGASVAYWGPEIKVGLPQPALNADMDAFTNVEALGFGFASDSRVQPIVMVHNAITKAPIPVPVPDIAPLNPPLGLIPPLPKKFELLTGTAKLSTAAAALAAVAKASRTSEAVTGTGSLDVVRYGRVLKARRLVGVRGVGPAFDGLYYVKSVTHTIKRGEYKQSFTLTRNGLLSTVPAVPA
ncbi:MAG: hypothetical protein HYU41_25860 [Candidatus Rokubacteria bacterium]|nr:hypothetical protein [Candidatus Rokubacteria bacterium]